MIYIFFKKLQLETELVGFDPKLLGTRSVLDAYNFGSLTLSVSKRSLSL